MLNEKRFIQLFSLGLIDSDGEINEEEVEASAERQAEMFVRYMTESMDCPVCIMRLYEEMFYAWIMKNEKENENEFAELFAGIYEEIFGTQKNNHFLEYADLMDSEMYSFYVSTFLEKTIIQLRAFFYEIAMEDVFRASVRSMIVEVLVGGDLDECE
jgi:hypothetical protein